MIISIVIPCYNAGSLLTEALESVEQTYNRFNHTIETIIVNDGSTDLETIAILKNLDASRYILIHQPNMGVAVARNRGIQKAKGELILFLDADNKIKKDYIDEASAIFMAKPSVGVVYGKPDFFGEVIPDRFFYPIKFDFDKLLHRNYIDTCCMVRKITLEQVNGFDENRLIMGHDDWDLWIRIYLAKWDLHFIDKKLFDYRISSNSMLGTTSSVKSYNEILKYISGKYYAEINKSQAILIAKFEIVEKLYADPITTAISILYLKRRQKLKKIVWLKKIFDRVHKRPKEDQGPEL